MPVLPQYTRLRRARSLLVAATAAISIFLVGCAGSSRAVIEPAPGVEPPAGPPPPAPVAEPLPPGPVPGAERELRGVWIATVDNIDWPSEPGLDPSVQRDEMRSNLDIAAALNMNAVIFQVRPIADALYRSDMEPMSWYLTADQGADPGYDPLSFAVEEAHRRGLELHAWINPYRAGHPTMEGAYDSLHVSLAHPDWVVQYGAQMWLDPGNEEAREHSLAVALDIVRRYDVDGIHMDDYFYPYPISAADGEPLAFPDTTSRARAVAAGETLGLADWRRRNVDLFIETLYRRVKEAKPWVKIGIAPFGIYRPGHPEGIIGFDQYQAMYADPRRWLREGWVDYMAPQLYWALDSEGQPYAPLLDWWIGENVVGRHVWPGNFTSRVIPEGGSTWTADEIVRQVEATRQRTGATGNIHFSMRALLPGKGVDSLLAVASYAEPALVPRTEWLGGAAPGVPAASARKVAGRHVVDLAPGPGTEPFVWHVREVRDGAWQIRIVPAWKRLLDLGTDAPSHVVISAVNRLGLEGPDVHVVL